jgi:hypothetical protein
VLAEVLRALEQLPLPPLIHLPSPQGKIDMTESTSLAQLRAPAPVDDQAVDMFTARGFELAVRIGKAFATSNAVPAQFRNQVEKKVQGGFQWVENPAALGNCIVAIETARAVGMSITAVMQQANIIEGKLSWSAQFVIGAINASGRFTPLRFDMKPRGPMKATYKEKKGWNDQKRGFDFVDKTVEIDNVECIAWALPKGYEIPRFSPEDLRKYTLLELVRSSGLPVTESAPVSMKMAVEEGWYGKSGSKWQTEMRTLMLQYRAGAFFGRIHAPDIVMGMGRTSEEVIDMTTVDVAPDGRVTNVSMDQMRKDAPPPTEATVVGQVNTLAEDERTGEVPPPPPAAAATPPASAFDAKAFGDRLRGAKDKAELDALGQELQAVVDDDVRSNLEEVFLARLEELSKPAATPPAPATRRTAARTTTAE